MEKGPSFDHSLSRPVHESLVAPCSPNRKIRLSQGILGDSAVAVPGFCPTLCKRDGLDMICALFSLDVAKKQQGSRLSRKRMVGMQPMLCAGAKMERAIHILEDGQLIMRQLTVNDEFVVFCIARWIKCRQTAINHGPGRRQTVSIYLTVQLAVARTSSSF